MGHRPLATSSKRSPMRLPTRMCLRKVFAVVEDLVTIPWNYRRDEDVVIRKVLFERSLAPVTTNGRRGSCPEFFCQTSGAPTPVSRSSWKIATEQPRNPHQYRLQGLGVGRRRDVMLLWACGALSSRPPPLRPQAPLGRVSDRRVKQYWDRERPRKADGHRCPSATARARVLRAIGHSVESCCCLRERRLVGGANAHRHGVQRAGCLHDRATRNGA